MSIEGSLYLRMGGEPTLRDFVDNLYDFMDSTPEVACVRSLHTGGLSHASRMLYAFLSGELGGPQLHINKISVSRLRTQCQYFKIGGDEINQWWTCAQYAADQLDITGNLRDELMAALAVMVSFLCNNKNSQKVVT